MLTATNVTSTGKIRLSWNAVDGAESYQLYRSDGAPGNYRRIYSGDDTSYTDTSAVAGPVYYYIVRASAGTVYSGYSTSVNLTCDCAQPVLSIALNANGKPSLSWEAVDGATDYQLYRSDGAPGNYRRIYTGDATAFEDTTAAAGTTYYYIVRAVCATNSAANSAYSQAKSITPVDNEVYGVVDAIKWVIEYNTDNPGYALASIQLMDGTTQTVKLSDINGTPFYYVQGSADVDFLNGAIATATQYNAGTEYYLCRFVENSDGTFRAETMASGELASITKGVSAVKDSSGNTIFYVSNNTQFLIYDAVTGVFTQFVGMNNLDQSYRDVTVFALPASGIAEYVYLIVE